MKAEQNSADAAEDTPCQRQHVVKSGKPYKGGRPIYWPQETIRRAAAAMRESRSSDYFVLAKLALGAIRSRDDLLDLLNDPASQRPDEVDACRSDGAPI